MTDNIEVDEGEGYVDISVDGTELVNVDVHDRGVTVNVHEVARDDDTTSRWRWDSEVFDSDSQ